MPRTWPLALLLVSAALLAGCTSDDPPAASAPSTPSGGGSTPAPNPGSPGGGSGGATTPPASRPASPAPVGDAGDVQGEFAKAWEIRVPSVGARGMTVQFNLTGVEAGVPPTARVHLALLDPNGQTLRTGAIGLGGEADVLAWTLNGVEIAYPGAYTLQATAVSLDGTPVPAPAPAPGTGVPSAGLAKYQLYAWVEY